ncbi:endo-1,4-beta-xylanase [Streptomyces sp. NBC_01190]|uniref:endo-1,4-beta-xylanase n=1 Tax=Streptomyces sp. NBC_01190 TaxID=2903767 RepID=UPI0038667109|nr:endo-1,4-beta-xylanase [Streptomyces sp. NBC_01190]
MPPDRAGLRSHFGTGGPPAGFRATLSNVAAPGEIVQVTGPDIAQASPTTSASTVSARLKATRCTGSTMRGIRDSDARRTGDSPLIFTGKDTKKAAYAAVPSALGDTNTGDIVTGPVHSPGNAAAGRVLDVPGVPPATARGWRSGMPTVVRTSTGGPAGPAMARTR